MMKIREVIPKMTTIDEGKVINYDLFPACIPRLMWESEHIMQPV